jgi:hypothetical protein
MAEQAGDEDDKPHEIRNIKVAEVSLVDRPANLRTFLMLKSQGNGGRPMPEVLTDEQAAELETALNTPTKTEEDVIKALDAELGKALDQSARTKVIAALRLLGGITDGAVKALHKQLSGILGGDTKKADEKPVVEPAVAKKEEPVVKTTVAPEIVALAKAGDYEAITKAVQDSPATAVLLVELMKAQGTELAKRDAQIADLTKFQAEMVTKADDVEVAKLVTEAGLPGMSTEDQTKMVKAMTPEVRSAWFSHGKAIRANLALADTEQGTSRRGDDSYNPFEEINKRAAEIVQKSAGTVMEMDARVQVLEADPKLASDYRAYTRGEKV